MFGLVMASRRRDEPPPWYDADLSSRARNQRFEDTLERVLDTDYQPPQPNGDNHMQGLITSILKFGVLPGLAVWLIYMGVTEYRVVGARSLQIIEQHAQESTQRMDRFDRTQEQIVDLLRADCVNGAKTPTERDRCLEAGRSR